MFSFAVILWRLFGSRSQYKQAEEIDAKHFMNEVGGDYDFLKELGKIAPPARQRDIIRKVCALLVASNFLLYICLWFKSNTYFTNSMIMVLKSSHREADLLYIKIALLRYLP